MAALQRNPVAFPQTKDLEAVAVDDRVVWCDVKAHDVPRRDVLFATSNQVLDMDALAPRDAA